VILAHKRNHPTIDYGFAGDVDAVNTGLLKSLLDQQVAVVVAPITHDKNGQLLNTNADTIASALAVALSSLYETTLIYCFEKKGVLKDIDDEDSLIREINPAHYEELKIQRIIHSGMLPKLDNAFTAISCGVKAVIIGKSDDLGQLKENKPFGTRLSKNA